MFRHVKLKLRTYAKMILVKWSSSLDITLQVLAAVMYRTAKRRGGWKKNVGSEYG
jgi:hypothetical protein